MMADASDKYPDNAPGPYFVDQECIACDTCVQLASPFFKLTSDCDHAFVHIQPIKPVELDQCESAKKACPVNAIGVING